MTYANREEAGDLLAAQLTGYAGRDDVIVLGLVRGGVPVAARVAAALRAPLDVLVVRKLGRAVVTGGCLRRARPGRCHRAQPRGRVVPVAGRRREGRPARRRRAGTAGGALPQRPAATVVDRLRGDHRRRRPRHRAPPRGRRWRWPADSVHRPLWSPCRWPPPTRWPNYAARRTRWSARSCRRCSGRSAGSTTTSPRPRTTRWSRSSPTPALRRANPAQISGIAPTAGLRAPTSRNSTMSVGTYSAALPSVHCGP